MKVVVVGSGIAGLSAAIFSYLEGHEVILISKKNLDESNSMYAQGGIVYQDKEKNEALLEEDIQKASSFSSNSETVKDVIRKGPKIIEDLLLKEVGIAFTEKDGKLSLRKEGGHSSKRIIHYLDITGKKIAESLIEYLKNKTKVAVLEQTFLLDIAVEGNQVIGGFFKHSIDNDSSLQFIECDRLILAGGGVGECFENSTNPPTATGDVIASAKRAGAIISGMEFTQFHPTVLAVKTEIRQKFLISEAVRGEGACLLNAEGKDFMKAIHPLGSLAPRDLVSRSIYEEMMKTKTAHVSLDARNIDPHILEHHFPSIFNECLKYGIDIRKDLIPVSPAFHFLCGGIKVDANGKSNIEGLYAIGECANTGFHGANRLASTSLLECLVSAKNAIQDKFKQKSPQRHKIPVPHYDLRKKLTQEELKHLKEKVQKMTWENLGIVRYTSKIAKLNFELKQILNSVEAIRGINLEHSELCNIVTCSLLIGEQALQNTKSLGCHYIIDDKKGISSSGASP